MKQLLGALFCLFAVVCASAQVSSVVTVHVYSLRDDAFAKRGFDIAPWTYGDGATVVPGERFHLVAVQATAKPIADIPPYEKYTAAFNEEQKRVLSGDARVEIDATGTPRLVGFPECLSYNKGAPIMVSREIRLGVSQRGQATTQRVATGHAPGAIGVGSSSIYFSEIPPEGGDPVKVEVKNVPKSVWNVELPRIESSMVMQSPWWLFIVVEDTRAGSTMTPPAGDVAWRAASASALVMEECSVPAEAAKPLLHLAGGAVMGDSYQEAYVVAPLRPMTPTALPSSITVDGVVYTDPAQIERLFTPALAGFEQDAETGGFTLSFAQTEDGKPKNALNGGAVPDGLLYTVYTATRLDGPWQTLDEALKDKPLATFTERCYTRLQLPDLGRVVLPAWREDTARFYSVRQLKIGKGEKE